MRKVYLVLCIIIGFCTGYTITAFAYTVDFRNGFDPVPTTIYIYSTANSNTQTAVHNACVAWNGSGAGDLIFRSTTTHTVTTYPYKNGYNQITKGNRGYDTYLMQTASISYSRLLGEVYEADIDINSTYAWSNVGDGYDIQSGITHEEGHLLGLDHSSVTAATMYKTINAYDTSMRTLETDDKNGIKYIYN